MKQFLILVFLSSITVAYGQYNDSNKRNTQMCLRLNDAPFAHIQQANEQDSNMVSNSGLNIAFYKTTGKNFSFGFGSGIETSKYYFTQIKKHANVLQMPLYLSARISTDNQLFSLIEEVGILLPVRSDYALGAGAYLRSGIQMGSKKIRFELSYKILSAPQHERKTLFCSNISAGLFFVLLSN